jgi:transposase
LYIRQPSLFSFDELMKFQPQTRLEKIFSTLDLSVISKHFPSSSRGPKSYDRESMLRAMIAALVYGIPTCTKLVERLKTDLRFKYDCGFSVLHDPPSESTFCRFFSKLSQNEYLQELFNGLVKKAMDIGLVSGKNLAIDSSEIDAYEKTVPKTKAPNDGKNANWGAKKDSQGNQITWFGYKLHTCVDADSELPIAITVTPANEHDSIQTVPLLEKSKILIGNPENVIMDSAYDQKYIYEHIFNELNAQAIIPLNKRGEKIPPEGLDENHHPVCSMGFPLIYWGCDKQKGELKFRCPHVMGKIDCPMGSCWCSTSNYGLVVKKKVKDDPRNFCMPHRGTKNWQKLYNKRTSVERFFGRLKDNLNANNLKVRGIKKVTAHLLLCSITLLAGTLAVNLVQEKAA